MARRELRAVAAALCVFFALAAASLLRPPAASADPLLTCPDTPIIHQVCSVATAIPNLAADGAEAVVGGVFDQVTKWVVDGAKAVVGFIGEAIDNSTRPDVKASWFEPNLRLMVQVGVAFLLPLVILAALSSLLKRDLGGLGRMVGVKLPVAAMGGAAGVFLVDMLVKIVDNLSGFVGSTIGGSGERFATGIVHLMEAGVLTGNAGPAGFLAFLVALFIALFALLLWVELVVRQAAVLVATLFLPIGFAGMVWETTSHWLRKLTEGLLAFILAKFVITAVVAVGANAVAAGGDNPAALILGAGILLVAVFTPYVLLSIIPLGTLAVVEGLSRRPIQAGTSTMSTLYFGSQLLNAGGGATPAVGAGGNGPGATPPPPPSAAPAGGAAAGGGGGAGAAGGGAAGAGAGGGGAAAGAAAPGGPAAAPVAAGAAAAKTAAHTAAGAARSAAATGGPGGG